MLRLPFAAFALLMLLPVPSLAAPAITCHCFTDRAYDPSRPADADPYFLATTQNSLFAALFNVDKKTVVMKKQAGNSADDMWIAYWVASRSAASGEALLAARGKKGSWREVIVPLGLSARSLGERFSGDVAGGASSEKLAREIVDDVLVGYRLLGEAEVKSLRKEWASNQEMIIAALIAAKSRRPALQLYRDAKKGVKSWGAFLSEVNMQPAGLQSEFAALLKSQRR